MKLSNKQRKKLLNVMNVTLTTGMLASSILPVVSSVALAQERDNQEVTEVKESENVPANESTDDSFVEEGPIDAEENNEEIEKQSNPKTLDGKSLDNQGAEKNLTSDNTLEKVGNISEEVEDQEKSESENKLIQKAEYTNLYINNSSYIIQSTLGGNIIDYNVTVKEPNVVISQILDHIEKHYRNLTQYRAHTTISMQGNASFDERYGTSSRPQFQELTIHGNNTNLSIPKRAFYNSKIETVKLYDVKKICSEAFTSSKLLKKVEMDSVESIEKRAFAYLPLLTEVNLPNVTSIGLEAFRGNNSLTEVNLPNVTKIESSAFHDNSLTEVNLPNVTEIGDSAFKNNNLTEVNIPNVTEIRIYAFSDNSLTEVNLPNVTKIESSAFENNNLTEVNLPNVTEMGSGVFRDNDLRTVYVPKLISYPLDNSSPSPFSNNPIEKVNIGGASDVNMNHINHLFGSSMLTLEELTILNMKNTGDYVSSPMKEYTALKHVSLPEATSIGKQTFKGNESLTSVNLPKVTSIGDSAFYDNPKLTSINLPKVTSIGDSAFYDNINLTSLDFPEAVSLGKRVFFNDTHLKNVNIPKVTSIGDEAFAFTKVSVLFLPTLKELGPESWSISNLEYVFYPNKSTDNVKSSFDYTRDVVGVGIGDEKITYNVKEGEKKILGFDSTLLNPEAMENKTSQLKGIYEKNGEKLEGTPLNYEFIANEETAGTYQGKLVLDDGVTQTETGATREFTVNVEKTIHLESDLISSMVSEQLKIDPTHDFTEGEIGQIKEFSIKNSEEFVEKDLEDIAKLSELEKLWIEGVGLKDISPLASNTKLVELYLANNEIEDITALSHMPSLVKFYAERNKISDLKPLENLGKLTMLWLGTNQIKDVTPLRNKTTMKWLFLENNQVADVSSLTNLTNLVRVHLGSNKLTDISSLANITTEMTEFNVSNNQIKDIRSIKDKVLNAKNQKIILDEQEAYNGQFSMKNVIEREGLEEKLGALQVKASDKGRYDSATNQVNWVNLVDEDSSSYEFSFGEGEIYSGVVTIPLKQVELVGPSVDSVVSTDKKITGKADANAVITAKVGDKEISKGNAKSDGSFELVIEAQPEGTKISVTQTVNGHESPATEVTVEKVELTAYNNYKLGYWRDYGFILEGQAGVFGKDFTAKTDVTKTVELVNTQSNEIEASSNGVNTNWYDITKYDGYQAIITNEMIDKLAEGNYRLQVKLTLKDGETVTQNLVGTDSLLRGFTGKYQDKISGLGKHSVGEKVLQFNEGLGQVTMNVAQGSNQVNVLNSRVNAKEESVLDLWIASKDYDYQSDHTKYLVIKDSSGKEVYNKKAPTWDIKKTFKKQVKAEWEKSGVQAIVPKEYRGASFTKEIQVKDKAEQVTVTTIIPQELSN